jgi:hypothetical protein
MEIYPWVYPTRDVRLGNQVIPEGMPVGLGLAAANLAAAKTAPTSRLQGNRAHLAYGLGPHACPDPAQRLAHQIVTDAIGALIDRVDGLRLAVPAEQLHRRPSIFAQALVSLPVAYDRVQPSPPISHQRSSQQTQEGGSCPMPGPHGSSWTPNPGHARSASSSRTWAPWSRWRWSGSRRGR